MEKALKELILALKSIANALMGKVNSSNNNNSDEGGFVRNYNTVVGIKGMCIRYKRDSNFNPIGLEDIYEEIPVFLFDKTKSLDENLKLFFLSNIEYMENIRDGQGYYKFCPVYENNNNKSIFDFNDCTIDVIDITNEYNYDNLSEFLLNENCQMHIRFENLRDTLYPTSREFMDFVPVDNKHYIIFFNDYLTLKSNNNNELPGQ